MDLGSVGFSADTSGLVQLQGELDRTKAKADETAASFQRLQASGQNSGPAFTAAKQAAADYQTALGNVIDKQLATGNATGAMETIVKNSNMTWGQASAAINAAIASHTGYGNAVKGTAAAQGEVNAATKESSGIFGTLTNALGLTSGQVVDHTGKVKALASEHRSGSHDMTEYREVVHSVGPALEQLGVNLSGMTQFSYAARGGIGILATAIGGDLLISIAKADDALEQTRVRLEGLAGVNVGTKLQDSLIDMESDLGKVASSMEPALEALTKFQQLQGSDGGHLIFAAGLADGAVKADQLKNAVQTLFEQLRLGGADETAAAAGVNKFFDDATTKGNVTGAMLRQLSTLAPAAAQSLTNALDSNSGKSAAEFATQLDKIPASVQSVIQRLLAMGAATDTAFAAMSQDPKTVAEAVTLLKHNFDDLWDSVNGGQAGSFVIGTLKAIADQVKAFNAAVHDAGGGWAGFWTAFNDSAGPGMAQINTFLATTLKNAIVSAFGSVWDAVGTSIKEWWSSFSIADAVQGFVTNNILKTFNIASVISDALQNNVAKPIIDFFGGTQIADAALAWAMNNIVNPIVSAVKAGANAISGLLGSSGGAAAASSSGGSSSGAANTSGGSSGSSTDFAQQVADGTLPAFATGGSFVVGGSGGTDSQLIQFMATPGELVSIDQPGGGSGQTLGSLIPTNDNTPAAQGDVVSAGLSEDIKTQTAAINDKLGTVKDAVVAAIASLAAAFKATVATTTIATAATGTTATPSTTSTTATATPTSTAASSSSGGATLGGINPAGLRVQNQPQQAPQPQQLQQPKLNAAAAAKAYADWQKRWDTFSQNEPGTSAGLGADGKPISSTTPINPNNATQPLPGMPGSQFSGPVAPASSPPASFADRFNAANPTNGLSAETVKQQTDALKQSQADTSKTVADAVTSQTTDTKSIGDKTNQALGNVDKSTQDSLNSLNSVNQATQAGNLATTSGFDAMGNSLGVVQQASDATTAGVGQTTDAVSTGSSDIVGKLGSVGSEIASAVAGAAASAPSSSSSGIGSSGTAAAASGSGSSFGFSSSDGAAGGSSGIGSSSGGPDQTFSTDTSTPTDFAAAVGAGTLPGMAVGGQFTVQGPGHTDTKKVEFWATPGETVTVTPPGGTPPPNPSMAGAPSKKSGVMAFATGGQFGVDGSPTPWHDTLTLGGAMGEPSMAGADIVAAHLADNTRSQTADLKDKLDQIAAKVIDAITAAANSISNTVTAALASAQAAASATAAAAQVQTQSATTANPTTTAAATTSTSTLRPGWAINPTTGKVQQIASYKNGVDQAGFSNPFGNKMDPSFAAMGISPFAGMAEGGTFIVPGGTGGSDSVSVGIKASPGERIMVLPPNEAKALDDLKNTIRVTPESLSKFMPALQDNIPGSGSGVMSNSVIGGSVSAAAVAASTSAGGPGAAQNVNIYVQQGVQADTFVQSRAQIQRAMRR